MGELTKIGRERAIHIAVNVCGCHRHLPCRSVARAVVVCHLQVLCCLPSMQICEILVFALYNYHTMHILA